MSDDYNEDKSLIQYRLDEMDDDIKEIKSDVKEIREIVTLGRIKVGAIAGSISLIVTIVIAVML